MGLLKILEDQYGHNSEKYIKIAQMLVDLKNQNGTILVEVWNSRAISKISGKMPLAKAAICLGTIAEKQNNIDTKAAWSELIAPTLSAAYALIKTKKLVLEGENSLDLTNAQDVFEE